MHHIIFDFDGVLGDTLEASIHNIINYEQQPTPELAFKQIQEYQMVPKHTRRHDLSEEEKSLHLNRLRQWGQDLMQYDFELFTGFLEEVAKYTDRSRLAVVSNGSELYVNKLLEQKLITFDYILPIEAGLSKEDRIETICKRWAVHPSESIYITDTVGDYLEIQHSLPPEHIFTVAWGWHGKEILEEHVPRSQILYDFTDYSVLFE